MSRQLSHRFSLFRPDRPTSNPYRIWLWVFLILVAAGILLQVRSGQIKPLFLPTPTPTRSSQSYALEAKTLFDAGKLDDPHSTTDAIGAYQLATQVDPNNAVIWAELARIQTYSSKTLTTDAQRHQRLQEALESARRARQLAPDDSTICAIYAFVLDWNATDNLTSDEDRQDYLTLAQTEGVRAYNLDPNNALALAFYAEVLLDQQLWGQAQQYAEQAVALGEGLMDTHRVYGTVLESLQQYRAAIQEYQRATEITPNLTFLYLQIGLGYRNLGNRIAPQSFEQAMALYEQALTYFDRAASINEQLNVRDPLPYIAIAKTYAQMGEFFIAARNAEKALKFDPTSANTYGQLGMIYVQARNYEFAQPTLQCAVEGCESRWLVPANEPDSLRAIHCMDLTGCNSTDRENAEYLFGSDYMTKTVAVQPLELTNLDIAYYYIRYGSVLAYLSRPGDGNCEKTLSLMKILRQSPLSSDVFLMQNIEDNEQLCYRLMGTAAP